MNYYYQRTDFRLVLDPSQYETFKMIIQTKRGDTMLIDIFNGMVFDMQENHYYTFVGKVSLCMVIYKLKRMEFSGLYELFLKLGCEQDDGFREYYYIISSDITRYNLFT